MARTFQSSCKTQRRSGSRSLVEKQSSLVDLRKGSEVLVYRETAGRHFGVPVDETITEQ